MLAARASYPCAPSRACLGDILHDRLRGLRCRARSHYVDRILGFSNEKREVRELRLKGKISNFMSMEAKDFMIIFFPPQTDSVRVDVSYNLIATAIFASTRPMAWRHITGPPDAQENDEVLCQSYGRNLFFLWLRHQERLFCQSLVNTNGWLPHRYSGN